MAYRGRHFPIGIGPGLFRACWLNNQVSIDHLHWRLDFLRAEDCWKNITSPTAMSSDMGI